MTIVVLCIIMSGCGIENVKSDSDKISIVTTVFSHDFARQIAGDKGSPSFIKAWRRKSCL